MSQDAEVGDGTTSVILLAGEFLREAKPFIEEGVHPQIIIKAYREAVSLAVRRLDELAVHLNEQDPAARRDMLERSAATSLSSKLVSGHKEFFAKMVRRLPAPRQPPLPLRPRVHSCACYLMIISLLLRLEDMCR